MGGGHEGEVRKPMRCTKCSGTGSEGYISFLRCGRCSGTGDEPKDALIPYSEELIVVPKGPVITALKEDPGAVEKKMAESSGKKRIKFGVDILEHQETLLSPPPLPRRRPGTFF